MVTKMRGASTRCRTTHALKKISRYSFPACIFPRSRASRLFARLLDPTESPSWRKMVGDDFHRHPFRKFKPGKSTLGVHCPMPLACSRFLIHEVDPGFRPELRVTKRWLGFRANARRSVSSEQSFAASDGGFADEFHLPAAVHSPLPHPSSIFRRRDAVPCSRGDRLYFTFRFFRRKVGTSRSCPSTMVGSDFSKRPRFAGSRVICSAFSSFFEGVTFSAVPRCVR